MPEGDELRPIRDKALAYLARRDHTRLELGSKLFHAGYPEDEVNAVLDELSQRGWLSGKRFAENYVEQKQARFGSQKLAHDLRQRGVAAEEIQIALETARETELERARAVWGKKFGTLPGSQAEKARQIRFLLGRGFALEVARKVLG